MSAIVMSDTAADSRDEQPWQQVSDQCLARLADVEAIDFFLACELQQELNAPPACFYLWMALHWALRQGHSCLDLHAIAGKTWWQQTDNDSAGQQGQKPGYRFAELEELLVQLSVMDLTPEAGRSVVQEGERLYLRRYWQFEYELADALHPRLQALKLDETQLKCARAIMPQLFPDAPLQDGNATRVSTTEPDWQAVAVANALSRRFSILSGGPGTGKTYTVTRLLIALQAVAGKTLRVQMAAPTGKAKQRLLESIGKARAKLAEKGVDGKLLASLPTKAHTLHGLLGMRPDSTRLRHDAKNKLEVDVLLIDEVSMVDLPMMTRVLRALPDEARLILVGDANQLPSIAVGSVLTDLVPLPHEGYSPAAADSIENLCGYRVPVQKGAQHDHVTLLRKSRRFDGSGEIGRLADAVLELQAEAGWQQLQEAKIAAERVAANSSAQLGWVAPDHHDVWLAAAVEYYFHPMLQAADLSKAFELLAAFRILLPTRVGPKGVEALNEAIETQLARRNPHVKPGVHYAGRPIMVTRNNHGLGLFNGDVGLVWPNEQGKLEACFEQEGEEEDKKIRRVNLGLLPPVETVFAMTIHKTQGSEFDQVALLLPDQAQRLLSPELIYTGITRAKNRCVVLTSEQLWKGALEQRAQRWSGLAERLGSGDAN
jgi:exodeoxyribonuclease V alpha subunit